MKLWSFTQARFSLTQKIPPQTTRQVAKKRRDFIKDSAVSALAIGTAPHTFEPETFGSERSPSSLPRTESKGPFWPDGARLVVSISMQMEAGAQPLSGAESPMPK